MTSHKDIARVLHITQSTVSRALDPNRSHLISEETRRRVLETAQSLGYQSNIHARRTRTRCSEALTLVMDIMRYPRTSLLHGFSGFNNFNEFSHILNDDAISGVIDGAAEMEFEVKLLPMHSSQEPDWEKLKAHLQFPYSDGVVFLGFNRMRNFQDLLSELSVPQVMITNARIPDAVIPQIRPGLWSGMSEALGHLHLQGIERIYYQALDMECSSVYYQFERLRSWQAILQDAGVPLEIAETRDREDISRFVDKLAKQGKKTLILSANDSMAAQLAQELVRRGISIPDQIRLVGCDGNAAYEDLSSVSIDYHALGREAARALVHHIKTGDAMMHDLEVPTAFKNGRTA